VESVLTWDCPSNLPCNSRHGYTRTTGSYHLHINNDASIIASCGPNPWSRASYSGSYLWLKPTPQWIHANDKDEPSTTSSSKQQRPRQQHLDQYQASVGVPTSSTTTPTPMTVMTIEEKKREEESKAFKEISSDPNRYSIKYSTYLNYLIVLSDGRWLACWDRTIYWLPIHNHKRMMIAHQHYDTQAGITETRRSTVDSIETKIDGYADIFARLPINHLIEEMYPLDGNVYGIASDLFITLVRVGGATSAAGIKKWMIWSVSTYDQADKSKKITIKPVSVWTIPDNEKWVHSLRPLCIDAGSVLINAIGSLVPTLLLPPSDD
jgi:hypothetical protein